MAAAARSAPPSGAAAFRHRDDQAVGIVALHRKDCGAGGRRNAEGERGREQE
jgi:hypothetical protein